MKGHRREAHEERSRQAINRCSATGPRRNCRPYGPVPYGAFDIRKRYALDGATALRDKPGGGEGNRGRALTEQREVDIRALLRGQMPDQLKMSFALWTRHAVRE